MTRAALALALAAALVAAATSTAIAAPPPVRGVAVGLYGESDVGWAIDEIARLGATHVALAVFWRQRDVRSVELAPAKGITVPDDRLRAAIRRAHGAGLKVFLLPIVDVEKRAMGEWRGTLRPASVDAWWMAYERFILHYATIAGEEDVALYAVGSELASTELWRDRWYHLISGVARRYRGSLTYSANWDHFEAVSFWERLDVLGVTGYVELTKDPEADVEALTASWRRARDALLAFAGKQRKPLILTEVGYTSQDGAAVHPWDYTVRARIDVEEQRRCWAAFIAAWRDVPALRGVFVWEWSGAGGDKDPGYTPRGKPAEALLRRWFAE